MTHGPLVSCFPSEIFCVLFREMYWTDHADSYIGKADMNGGNAVVFIDSKKVPVRWPNGLAIDFQGSIHIYVQNLSATQK